jgi:hypothetical protein
MKRKKKETRPSPTKKENLEKELLRISLTLTRKSK